jgi:hypothetical protein
MKRLARLLSDPDCVAAKARGHPTVSESIFPSFMPIVLSMILFKPALNWTVIVTVLHVVHEPVLLNARLGLTVTPFTCSDRARLAASRR